jgi:hypothetical protein
MPPSVPFIDLSLFESADAPLLVAIRQTDQDVRDTPSHSHSAGQLLGSAQGLLSVSCGNSSWAVPATHAMDHFRGGRCMSRSAVVMICRMHRARCA